MRSVLTFLFAAQATLFGQASDALGLEQILAKHFEAVGGLEKLASIKTGRATIKATRGQAEFKSVTETMEPGFVRIERGLPNGNMHITIINESGGWMFEQPENGGPTELSPRLSDRDIGGIRLMAGYGTSPFAGYEDKGFKVELKGMAELGDGFAHKVSLTTKEGLEFVYFIDSMTYLPAKMERGGSATIFSDYREIDGLKAAHCLELPGASLKMVFEKIEINPAIDRERFQLPEAKGGEAKTEEKSVDKK